MGNRLCLTDTRDSGADRPDLAATLGALDVVAAALDADVCWLYRGGYHFRLPLDDWTLALTPESAGRFRIEACHRTLPRSTVWVLAHDVARLAHVAREIADEAAVRSAA